MNVCVCVCVCVCAVEALGRLSPEAQGLLNSVAPEDKALRSVVLRRAKQTLSVLIQTRLAELLLSAEPSREGALPALATPAGAGAGAAEDASVDEDAATGVAA